MDLTLTETERAFRDELRAWLEANNPGRPPEDADLAFEFQRDWQRRMHRAGWVGVSWPAEYGGRGASIMESAIYNEELVRARAPQPVNLIGLVMGGPVIITHGTDAQRRRFLEPILSAEEIWCQGFSEPDAGSDLAALTTRAERDGDGWRISGQKVWTSFAHVAKWCMLLARTDPAAEKHKGLTFFLMDMDQAGVDVRPLRQITGDAEFNEIFMDGARVPGENVLGTVGGGWRVAISTLMHERGGLAIASAASIQMQLDELAALLIERGLAGDPGIAQRFGDLCIRTETMRLNGMRGLTRVIRQGEPGPEGSITKVQSADINQAMSEFAVEVLGVEGLRDDERWAHRMLRARANSIEGGTSEVQRNLLAERVLGLAKSR